MIRGGRETLRREHSLRICKSLTQYLPELIARGLDKVTNINSNYLSWDLTVLFNGKSYFIRICPKPTALEVPVPSVDIVAIVLCSSSSILYFLLYSS